MNQEKRPEVATVFPDGPAAIAQLQEHDIITYVDGHPTNDLKTESIYGMLVGQPATKVKITIHRGGATFVKTLVRMRAKDFAKIHPDIWEMYRSSM
jgi:C-terminal processing protease CtpA/Prc